MRGDVPIDMRFGLGNETREEKARCQGVLDELEKP
jgi:hypothetical protein